MRTLQRIAHVDDDESIRAVTKVALERIGGFTLLSCASGKEALEKIAAFNPNMILLDVMMPGMDGPSTLQKLQDSMNLENVAVIFMSAKVLPTEIESYRKIGAWNVLLKPFDAMGLSEQLEIYWKQFNGE